MAIMDHTTIGPQQRQQGVETQPALRVVYSGASPSNELHALRPGVMAIGRGVDSVLGLRLDDPRLSRQHARVIVGDSGARIVNDSRHGTLRNGVPVVDAPLTDGDVLQLGDTLMIFRLLPSGPVDASVPAVTGVSPEAVRLRSTVRLVAPTSAAVLVLGPTGTGKEVVARALHEASGRRGPFVCVNPAAIPDLLADSELFGHVAGAFAGAVAEHDGCLRRAAGGTLFIDELAELPLALQGKLLRVLDERRAVPLGSIVSYQVDARMVAASNVDLDARVQDGRLRADLYARLAEITIHLPPVGTRREDVLPLLLSALPKGHAPLEPALVAALLAYPWPYNVREVQKVGTELGVLGAGRTLLTLDLVADRLRPPRASTPPSALPSAAAAKGDLPREPVPGKDELLALLKRHAFVIADVARATGRSRKQVYRWLDKHGLRDATADKERELDDDSSG